MTLLIRGMLFLLLKFPLGIFSFVITVTSLAISLAFLFAPFLILTGGVIDLGPWYVDTLAEAFLCSLIGAFLHVVVLHILSALGWAWGLLAKVLLGKSVD